MVSVNWDVLQSVAGLLAGPGPVHGVGDGSVRCSRIVVRGSLS